MPTTSKGLRYPATSAAPNVPQDIQNLASDVDTRLPTAWATLSNSAASYSYDLPTAIGTPVPNTDFTVTVPANRTASIRFTAPLVGLVAGSSVFIRLERLNVGTGAAEDILDGVELAGSQLSTTRWFPLRLEGDYAGNGGNTRFRVVAWATAGGCSIKGSPGAAVGVHLKWRVI